MSERKGLNFCYTPPPRRDSRCVFSLWQSRLIARRLSSSSVPPWARATMWSTSCASRMRPSLAQLSHRQRYWSRFRIRSRLRRHGRPPRPDPLRVAQALACSAARSAWPSQYPLALRCSDRHPSARHGRCGLSGMAHHSGKSVAVHQARGQRHPRGLRSTPGSGSRSVRAGWSASAAVPESAGAKRLLARSRATFIHLLIHSRRTAQPLQAITRHPVGRECHHS